MIDRYTPVDLGPIRSLRSGFERAIRSQCPEPLILQVHDDIYTPIKQSTGPILEAVAAFIAQAFGNHPTTSLRQQNRMALRKLCSLLDAGAKERELQDALVGSGMLALDWRVVQEVTMNPTEDYRGMRMDIVLDSMSEEPSQVVELKRGSHLLLARRGKPAQRLSKGFNNAVAQLRNYGSRIEHDAATAGELDDRHGIRLEKPVLRLIAGRRLPDAHDYYLLSLVERDALASGLQLLIYTWDGFLAELERIHD